MPVPQLHPQATHSSLHELQAFWETVFKGIAQVSAKLGTYSGLSLEGLTPAYHEAVGGQG